MTEGLNRIRSLKTLEEMKETCNKFLVFDPEVMISLYEKEYKWGIEDYEADREQVQFLLENVEKRIKSLSNFLNKSEVKVDKSASPRLCSDSTRSSE